MAVMFLLVLMAGNVLAAEIIASGECGDEGDNLTWTLDADGVLTIYGSGGMYVDYYADDEPEGYTYLCPWKDYSQDITRVILPEGLEDITDNAFAGCENLSDIVIPGSANIGEAAFASCTGLKTVVISDGVSWIGQGAFSGCTSLESIYIPGSVMIIDYFVFYDCGSLADIYYGGDRADWEAIEIIDPQDYDGHFSAVTIHYNSYPPAVLEEPESSEVPEPIVETAAPVAQASFAEIASWNVCIAVDGKFVNWTDAGPYIDENDRTMANFLEVGETLGLYVEWDSETGETSFSDGTKTICFPVGSKTARSDNGSTIEMDTTAAIFNDQPYVPVRYLAEFFGRSVSWDLDNRMVTIN